ncbi:MAG: hypothetical protein JWP75_38, partial [Frondihabitans sp.]|nr:hypothetical protein [Frondihabitans sp.]
GQWTKEGSVLVPLVTGLTANDDNGDVTIYATSSGSDGTTGTISAITDDSGVGGTLAGVASSVATLPSNEAIRGVAFAPGTVIGSGGGVKPPVVEPTITPADTALPAALGDANNETVPVTVGDPAGSVSDLTMTATSSNPTVAADSGITISGSGASRTLSVTPASTGISTITLTATAPDGRSAATQISYGVSADLSAAAAGNVSYLSGAANASAAVDAGDGYAFVGDDESDTLRLYDLSKSGSPVASFDFDSLLPDGDSEIDIEGATRQGDVIYWEGSMSTSSSGKVAAARSTVFATRVTGAGADATLTYLGSYTGLLADLVAWDQAGGSGLGDNYLGLAESSAAGVDGHSTNALNVEGLEFTSPTSSTAYLAFRAPLEPTTNRHLAMLIPVTNYSALATSGNQTGTHATFGKPIFFNLGGLGIRDIKENASGQFLIIAGTADGSNTGFSLYTWDGEPTHAPLLSRTTLPQIPSGANAGSWETIVSVPETLTQGSSVRLVQDDGDTDWYGDGLTSKTGEAQGLQKSLAATFSYVPPAGTATRVTAATLTPLVTTRTPYALLGAVLPTKLSGASLAGTVTVTAVGPTGALLWSEMSELPALLPLFAQVVPAGTFPVGTSQVTIMYSGNPTYAPSSTTLTVKVSR